MLFCRACKGLLYGVFNINWSSANIKFVVKVLSPNLYGKFKVISCNFLLPTGSSKYKLNNIGDGKTAVANDEMELPEYFPGPESPFFGVECFCTLVRCSCKFVRPSGSRLHRSNGRIID